MKENRIVANNGSSIVLYTADDGNTQLEVKLEKDTVWLTQSQMAELFGRDRTVVGRHIAKVYQEGELSREVTCAFFAQVTPHGAMPGKTHSRQHPRCPYPHDCREPNGGERRDGEGRGEFDKSGESVNNEK